MSTLDNNWQIIENVAAVNDIPFVRLPLITNLIETAGRNGTDELLVCNTPASVTDHQGALIPTLANEIRCVGARRVDHSNTTDYGTGALGVEYFDTDDSGNPLGVDLFGNEYLEAVTNLVIQSEDLSTSWTLTGVDLLANDAVAPDGTTTADKLTDTVAAGTGQATTPEITLLASTKYSFSLYMKPDDATSSKLWIYDTNFGAHRSSLSFNWVAGVPSTAISGDNNVTEVTYKLINSDWWRISFAFVTDASVTTHHLRIDATPFDDQESAWVWGAQLNIGSRKPYVPTTTVEVTVYPLAGQLIESANKNDIKNSIFNGATVSSGLPSGWLLDGSGSGNISEEVLSIGTHNGFDYIEVKLTCTGGTSNDWYILCQNVNAGSTSDDFTYKCEIYPQQHDHGSGKIGISVYDTTNATGSQTNYGITQSWISAEETLTLAAASTDVQYRVSGTPMDSGHVVIFRLNVPHGDKVANFTGRSFMPTFGVITVRDATDARADFPTTIANDFKVDFDFSGLVDSPITGVNRTLFSISNDAANCVVCYVNSGSKFLSLVKMVGGTPYISTTTLELDLTIQHSVSCEISSITGVTLTVDGLAATADANTTDPVLTDKTVYIGQLYDQTNHAGGSVKNLTIYKDTSAAPYTTRLTLTEVGTGLVGAKVAVTGVGGSTAYEDKQFSPVIVDDNNVDVDWSQFGLSAPPDTWTVGGMIRLYQTPSLCAGSMRVLFNNHNITSITSTGSTAAETDVDQILNSDRNLVHELDGGVTHSIVATLSASTDKLVTGVALLDYVGGDDDQIRIEGEGEVYPVDVVYPATAERYSADEAVPNGYPRVLSVLHFISYMPPMLTDDVTIGILDVPGSTTAEFSELMLGVYWSPATAKNFTYGNQTKAVIDSDDVWRGASLGRNHRGVVKTRSASLRMMDEKDCVYADLMMNACGTILFDSYPLEMNKRYRTMVAGYLVGEMNVSGLEPGQSWPIEVLDSKKQPCMKTIVAGAQQPA